MSLSIWLYQTYLNDMYFQSYANGLSPILVPVLSVAFGISSASIATYLYLGMKRIRTIQQPEVRVKKKVQQRKTPTRNPQPSPAQAKVAELPSPNSAKPKPVAPPHSHVLTPPLKEQETHKQDSENRKRLA